MKRFILVLISFFCSLNLMSQKLEFTYNIETPVIQNIGNFQLIVFENSKQLGKTGSPSIPYIAVKLLLPAGTQAKNIEFIFEQKTKIEGTFEIYPFQNVSPMGEDIQNKIIIDNDVYSSTKYPSKNFSGFSTQFMNGYGFAISNFSPIEYNPSTGEVFYYQKVTAVVNYETTEKSSNAVSFLSSRPQVLNRISDFAQNSDMLKNYPQKKNADSYDMLIITTGSYVSAFNDLVIFHRNRGIDAHVVTLSDITSQMTGVDDPEKMRNFIIQEYQNHDIQYVLLGGDADVVPYRGLFCHVQSSSVYEDDNIPADVYFSGLDGTWNADNDNLWGEPDEDDLLPEIAVGRLPFSNATELGYIIHKIIYYSNQPVTSTGELNDPLLAGEHLYDDPNTEGSDYLNMLIGLHTENGYTTNGIPENSTYTTMYNEDQAWSGQDIMNEMNTGHSFVHHVGHANSSTMMNLYTSDITNTNFSQLNGTAHNYALIYSHGCICGAFDDDDCISETMVKIQNCAVAVFTNSRYGWFNQGQTEGPSAHLHREFVDALYNDKQNHAGIAEMISKYETAPWCEVEGEFEPGAQRWCFYDHNVMTDPALPIWTQNPVDFSVSYDDSLALGADYIVNVNTTKSPIANATCFILQNNVIVGKSFSDITGQANILVDINLAIPGAAQLIVVGYNTLPKQYNITIIEPVTAVLSVPEFNFSDNNNDLPEYNENGALVIKIKNYGQQQATNVQLTLSSNDSNISILNGTQNIGTIAGLDSVISTDILTFEIDNVPDQYSAILNLQITSDQYSTTRNIPLIINAPKFNIASFSVTEGTGSNNNGRLDPGEIGTLNFDVQNIGHCNATEVLISLSGNENSTPYLNITNLTQTENLLMGSNTISFDVSVSENAIQGDSAILDLDVYKTSIHNTQSTAVFVIGQPSFIVVGNGTSETTNYPLYNWYENNKTQILFLSNEITTGTIEKLSLFVSAATPGGYNFNNFTIKIMETNLTALSTDFVNSTTATTVFSNATLNIPDNTGELLFDITDFNYSGNQNLLIETRPQWFGWRHGS